jgi:hypothetical protein
MKNLKRYQKGPVDYGYNLVYRGWEFIMPGHTLILHCKGQEVAHKVANVCAGSLTRNGCLDNLARANIKQLTAPVVAEAE